jgi:alkyldihydroxyacetonephosphate synthase
VAATVPVRRRRFWGWGWDDAGPDATQRRRLAELLAARFGIPVPEAVRAPTAGELRLPAPRVSPPARLAPLASAEPADRAAHAYGKSFRDVVRALRREYPSPPDFVVRPAGEDDVAAVLDWATGARVAVVPYGGGSSVVGGVETRLDGPYAGVVSLDLGRLDRVLEVDRTSRAARIQAGVLGPHLEEQLRPHGLTLRHFPQSFEFSSLGGWIATRSGGHYATLYTHVDEFVESLRVLAPCGAIATRRLPGSGAGPSPDRLFIGSEGILGVIVEAWMRLQDRPTFRAAASVTFADFAAGAEAARAVVQAGLHPSNCRLLDPGEAAIAGAGAGDAAILLLAFESADHDPGARMARALALAAAHGGTAPDGAGATQRTEAGARDGAAGRWRSAFLDAPYLRDTMAALGMVSETFETAVTWDRFPEFHAGVVAASGDAVRRECGAGQVTCRFTHVYPDGPAPYYTVLAPGRRGAELEQWAAIKGAAADAILRLGGTITHHHAVGRDHRPWYDRERPDGFAAALAAAKRAVDPGGILNPGVLIDPVATR